MATAQGVSLGTATGYIQIDTSSLLSARRVVIGAANDMGNSARGFGQEWDSQTRRFRANLGAMGSDLKRLSGDLTALGVGGGIIAGIGIRSAASIEVVNLRFRTLLGSQQAASAEMERIRDIAQDLNAPVTQAQQAFAAMLPTVKGNVAEAERLVRLSIRLASIDPGSGGGLSGARFALSEALVAAESGGSDFVSLSERFGISKIAIREAIAETGNFAEAIDLVLNRLGATEEFAREFGDTFTGAAAEAGDALNQALGAGFAATLKNVLTPALQSITSFLQNLQESNPALLQFISGMSLLAVALPAVSFGLGQIAATLAVLKSMGVIRLGVLLAAPVIGAQIGVGIGRFLADRGTGDERLRSDSGEDPNAVIAERLNQVLVILVHTIVEAAGRLAGALMDLKLRIDIGSVTLQMALFRMAADVARIFGDSSAAEAFDDLAQALKVRRGLLEKQLDAMPGAIDALVRIMQEDITGSMMQFLFPAIEEGSEQIERASISFADVLRQAVTSLKPIAADIAKLNTAFAEEAARIAETRGIDAQRDNDDYYRQRARDIADFNSQQAEAEQQALEQEQQQIEEIAQIAEEAQQQQVEALRDFHKESRRLAQDHRNEILDIQRDMSDGIEDAIAARDASAADAALENGQRRIQEENEQYNLESQRRQEDLEDLLENLEAQSNERMAAAVQELADMRAQHIELQGEREAAFYERLALEDSERAIRLQRLQEDQAREDYYRQLELQKKIQALIDESNLSTQMIALWQGTLAAGRAAFSDFISGLVGTISGASTTASSASTSASTDTGSTTATATSAFATLGALGNSILDALIPGRARGGSALGLTGYNEEGTESALFRGGQLGFFSSPATIYDASTSQRLMDAANGGGGGHQFSFDFSGSNFGNDFDQDEFQDDLIARILTDVIPRLDPA